MILQVDGMTIKRLRNQLELSQSDLAHVIGVSSDRTVRRWEDGERDAPGPAIILMTLMVKYPQIRDVVFKMRGFGDIDTSN